MKTLMRGKVWLIAAAGVLVLALAACGNGGGQDVGNASSGSNQSAGIHTTGTGTVTARPDLALVYLGVETSASTVSEARNDAARAVTAMIASLVAQGLQENTDIQTAHFSIQPEYVWEEELGTTRRTVQRLVGYRVTNTLVAKVRDLDKVGPVIDGAAEAGGDAARVNSVRFTLDDTAALQDRARVLAIQDAIKKADAFAGELGVGRGKLQYVTELGGFQPVVTEALSLRAADSASAPTPILAGELEVRVQVQTTFAIE